MSERFEAAVEALVSGDLEALRRLLGEDPELVHARSKLSHGATLLHYVAGNGVEPEREAIPENAVEVARLLLAAGAEADAAAAGSVRATPLAAVVASERAAAAGLQCALAAALLDHGAAVNGPRNDGAPLAGALGFGHTAVAELLARRGARVDNLVAAAGLGRLDLVEREFDASGRLRAETRPYLDVFGHAFSTPDDLLECSFFLACRHGRFAVAKFLLRHGVDVRELLDAGNGDGAPLPSEAIIDELLQRIRDEC